MSQAQPDPNLFIPAPESCSLNLSMEGSRASVGYGRLGSVNGMVDCSCDCVIGLIDDNNRLFCSSEYAPLSIAVEINVLRFISGFLVVVARLCSCAQIVGDETGARHNQRDAVNVR